MRSTWPTERTIIPKDGRYGFTQPHSSASSLQATSQCVAAVCQRRRCTSSRCVPAAAMRGDGERVCVRGGNHRHHHHGDDDDE